MGTASRFRTRCEEEGGHGDTSIQASGDHEARDGSESSRTWTHYPSVEDARAGAKLMYHNDRVLRVMVVTDSVGSFVEWLER